MSTQPVMTVRRPRIAFPERLDPLFIKGQPELAYVLVGISLCVPYLEPYLIRTMNKAKRRVTDPQLLQAISIFNGQEGQHFRLHMRFNKAIRLDYPEIAALEQEIADDYQRFTATKSLEWNLAYAEGFEAFTSAFAQFLFEQDLLKDADPFSRDLFEWHILEELEHRCVAFDVFEHLCGSYTYRAAVGAYAQYHILRFILRVAKVLMKRDRANGRVYGTKQETRSRLGSLFSSVGKRLLPKVLGTYLPSYTPHDLAMPPGIDRVISRLAGRDFAAELAASEPEEPARAPAPAPAAPEPAQAAQFDQFLGAA